MSDTAYLSIEEAAKRTGLSRRMLERLAKTGDGPPRLKVGARVLFKISDLDAWLAAHAEPSTTAAAVQP